MAVSDSSGNIFLVIFMLLTGQITPWGQETPTLEIVSQWATTVDKNLMNLNTIFANVNDIYQRKAKNGSSRVPGFSFDYKVLNEVDLVKEMAESLSLLLGKHVRALEKSVEAAEKIAAEYKWNNNLMKKDVTYMNAKELKVKENEIILTYNELFGKEVNFDISSVHIPVEIYDGNIDILNGLNWTAGLDEQFKKNQEEDPDMLWQYFGSQTGFLRFYPAAQWPLKGVDLYDVRRRSWYTQGSSSPKDMMILIDTSGSTHGQSLQLMQNAVKSILDTLGENDYVNIVAFAEQANFASRCFNHTAFVQANYRNKQRLMKDIDNLQAMGQADFTEVIRFAFEKFNEFGDNASDTDSIGADCNKVIMLLTDGGTDNAEEVFKEYNWPNKTVRVFTYAVGATPNPVKALRWMACANRGYFSQIPAMGAIRARVQEYTSHLREKEVADAKDVSWEITIDPREYIPVLSRPQVIMDEKASEWGNIYEDHLGLGMMTTVTRPVYNYSRESSNQTILGVMAIDVTTAQFEAKTPFSKIGPNGYSFAINPNGYVVFHPNLYTSGKFMTEPPNIDLLELEVDQNSKELNDLRSAMIEAKNGSVTISTYFLSPDQRYVTNDQADYAYVSITDTTFRLGLCVPTYQKMYPSFSGDTSTFDWSNADSSVFKVLIAPWDYHKNMKRMKGLTGTLDDVIHLLQKDPDPKNWNQDLLFHLYWDVMHIEPQLVAFMNISTYDFENETVCDNDTYCDIFEETQSSRTFFIMTNGGMTLVSPASEANYFKNQRDLRESSIFKRALRTTKCIFMADYTNEERSKTADTPYVITACGSYISQKNKQNQTIVVDKPAVAGQRLTHEAVIEAIFNATESNLKYRTCKDGSLLCYLVDDGGFLVATTGDNYREQIGRFFGQVDPPVFASINSKFFHKTVQYDFQATCIIEKNIKSAGFKKFLIPTTSMLFELLNVAWWTSKVNWVLNSFNLYSLFTSSSTQVYANSDDEEDNEKKCLEATYQYYINSTVSNYSDTISCQECTRNFSAVKLTRTNLLFIVVDRVCNECNTEFPAISQAPREMNETEEEEIVCQSAKNPRKRFRDYECHHSDPRENSSECGCAGLQISNLSVLLIIISVTLRWASTIR